MVKPNTSFNLDVNDINLIDEALILLQHHRTGTVGFEVEEITAQDINDVSVSSTKIRKAIENGKIEKKVVKSTNVIPKVFIGKRKGTLIITETK